MRKATKALLRICAGRWSVTTRLAAEWAWWPRRGLWPPRTCWSEPRAPPTRGSTAARHPTLGSPPSLCTCCKVSRTAHKPSKIKQTSAFIEERSALHKLKGRCSWPGRGVLGLTHFHEVLKCVSFLWLPIAISYSKSQTPHLPHVLCRVIQFFLKVMVSPHSQ